MIRGRYHYPLSQSNSWDDDGIWPECDYGLSVNGLTHYLWRRRDTELLEWRSKWNVPHLYNSLLAWWRGTWARVTAFILIHDWKKLFLLLFRTVFIENGNTSDVINDHNLTILSKLTIVGLLDSSSKFIVIRRVVNFHLQIIMYETKLEMIIWGFVTNRSS